MKVVFFKTAR